MVCCLTIPSLYFFTTISRGTVMNLVLTIEHRFAATPDGAVWTQTTFAYPFWRRYLEVFESVRVVARVRDVSEVSGDWKRADGEGVSFARIPYYLGPEQFLWHAIRVTRSVRNAVTSEDAVIMRVPSTLANLLAPSMVKRGHPFGLEVVGDPYDVFAPGAFRHPLRPLLRWWFVRSLRWQCARAAAAGYVTRTALQRRYPLNVSKEFVYSSVELKEKIFKKPFFTVYSDVQLASDDFAHSHSSRRGRDGPVTLLFVGSLAQMYKAPDVLIDSVALCVRRGLDIRLIMVGDGKHRSELERRAATHGLQECVRFMGQLPREGVQKWLDQADLFVLPSRQEGVPRAMLEAMARGLPCIGSTVGGIPELLPPEDMVPPGDVVALADKICEVLRDPERMAQMSARNFQKALEYREEVLREQRLYFYHEVRKITEEWQKQK
ncbi:MAG: glycosyltransferase [Candidatus Methanomethylicaceae archaeon]